MASEREFITHFRKLAAEKLMLGDAEGKLRQRDFEYLGKLIEEKSNIRLSVSTLKRLWKDDHTQEPHPATLDALATIVGYTDWRAFKNAYSEKFAVPKSKKIDRPRWPVFAGLGLIVFVAFFMSPGFNGSEDKKLTLPEHILFNADKTVVTGVPNTVVFTYDLSGISADSFFIQQSWNPRDKVRIDPKKNHISSIYYFPGFHRAKLIVNDSIVSRARIHIKTDGWMPIVQYNIGDNSPLYLNTKGVIADGVLRMPPNAFEDANVDLDKKLFLRYYNIRDFAGVDSDNFLIETRFKHDSIGTFVCPLAEITILTEEHIYYVPITSKGCIGELEMKIGEVYKSSRDNNLSGLGTDVFDWQTLRIENKQKKATVYLNGVQVTEIEYKRDFGKIVGIIYTFNGTGSVDYLRMKDTKGTMVYNDEFDMPL